jgi:hypothetical protein
MRFGIPIIVSALLICTSSVWAQNFGGGVHAGLVTSHVLEYTVPASYSKVGFWGGGFTDYRFTKNSTLQMELAFVQKGTRQAGTLNNNNDERGMNLNYLEMPILYRWWGIRKMSVEIGPQLGIMLSHREWDLNGDFVNLNYKDFERFELSAAAGLSYYVLRNKLEVNVRYSISVLPIRVRAQGEAAWPLARQYNSVIGFSLRYWFRNTYDAPPKKDRTVRNLE